MSANGYIVTWEGQPMWAETRKSFPETRGTLWCGRKVTVFPSRGAAARAVARTRKYAAAKGMDWSNQYRIIKLEPAHAKS